MNLTLTLRNLSKFSKRLSSSDYSVVLIVQDMKFGNEFIVKIYKKKTKINPTSYKCLPDLAPTIPSRKTYKLLRLSNDLSVKPRACIASKTSLKSIFPNPF